MIKRKKEAEEKKRKLIEKIKAKIEKSTKEKSHASDGNYEPKLDEKPKDSSLVDVIRPRGATKNAKRF